MVFEGAKKKAWRSRPRPVTVCIILQFTARLRECCLEAGVGGLHGRPHLGGEGEGEVGGVDHAVLAHQAQGNLGIVIISTLDRWSRAANDPSFFKIVTEKAPTRAV